MINEFVKELKSFRTKGKISLNPEIDGNEKGYVIIVPEIILDKLLKKHFKKVNIKEEGLK